MRPRKMGLWPDITLWASFGIVVALSITAIICLVRRRNSHPVKIRDLPLVITSLILLISMAFMNTFTEAFWGIRCYWRRIVAPFHLPLIANLYILRFELFSLNELSRCFNMFSKDPLRSLVNKFYNTLSGQTSNFSYKANIFIRLT